MDQTGEMSEKQETASISSCRDEEEQENERTTTIDNRNNGEASQGDAVPSVSQRPLRHPHGLRKGKSRAEEQKEQRDRMILFVCSCLTTFLFVGAMLGWGQMQLMVRANSTKISINNRIRNEPQYYGFQGTVDFRHCSLTQIMLSSSIARR
jgi:hypothetical protein